MPNRVTYSFQINDQFSRQARSISRRTKAIKTSMRALAGTAKVTGRVVAGAFATMKGAAVSFQTSMAPMLAGLAGVAGALKAFTIGTDFQDAMLDLQAITGASGEDLQFLKESALSMGKAAKLGAADTAKAFELVASAKPELLKNTRALAGMTEQVLLLSNASGLDLASATETVAESLNQFNLGADQAGRFVNVLAAGSKLGSSLVRQTGIALREVGGIASEAGISFETTNAALQLLAAGGVKGAKAGTQLKGALLSLAASGDKRITPSIVGLETALANLQKMQLSEQAQIKLFGRENLQTGQILSRTAGDLAELSKNMTGTNIATEQARIRMSGFSARLKGVGVTLSNAVIRVFEKMGPQLESIVAGLEKFFDSITTEDINNFAEGLKNVFSFLQSIASIAGSVAEVLGPVFRLMGASASGLADLGTLITGGELTAANSASLKNAVRIEKSEATIDMQVSAGPGSTIDSTKTATSGATTLNVGVNNAEAA